jgi:hypothetical protein
VVLILVRGERVRGWPCQVTIDSVADGGRVGGAAGGGDGAIAAMAQSLGRLFRRELPVPSTTASRMLRAVIWVTAVTVVVVEAVNLLSADEPGFSLLVRSTWALLRVVGLLFLARAVRYGRQVAKPFGLVLAVTTVFAVARLAEPRQGSFLPPAPVVAGFVVLAVECAVMVRLLYRSAAIDEHLSARPVRRHVPGWVLTGRMAVLSYAPLTLVPLLVALGTIFSAERRLPFASTVVLLSVWAALVGVLTLVAPFSSFLVVVGKRWARWLVGFLGAVVLLVQPALCYALLGVDGLVRDGAPLAIIALLGLGALHRSRGADLGAPEPRDGRCARGRLRTSVTDCDP